MMFLPRRCPISHRFDGLSITEILKLKRGSVKQAPLPDQSPAWEDLSDMTWEELEACADANLPGFRTIRKLLSDRRFDK
jgi:hypothetical protein